MLLNNPKSCKMERDPSLLLKFVVFALALYSSLILAKSTGSWRDVDPNSQKIENFAWKSIAPVNRVFNETAFSQSYLIPAKVISAKSQLVAGMNYKIDIEFGLSNCTKDLAVGTLTRQKCVLGYEGIYYDWQIHTILVFEQSWKNRTQITVVH